MNIHEYQAKALFEKYGVAVPRGIAARAATEQVRNGEAVDHPGVGPLLDALTGSLAR